MPLIDARWRPFFQKNRFEGQYRKFEIVLNVVFTKITILVVILTGLSKFVPIEGARWRQFF